jgi:DNA-binding GntR family transcriptional regulator
LSAPHLTAGDRQQALAALAKASASKDLLERAELHWEFHRLLYAKCGRPRLLAQISNLHLGINRYLLPIWSTHGLSEHWDESHEQIVNALARGKVQQAMKIVVEQIGDSCTRVLSALQSTDPPPQRKGKLHA